MPHIVVIEPNEQVSQVVARRRARDAWAVSTEGSLENAKALARPRCSLIILEPHLPDGDGFDLLHELRAGGDVTPVFITSSQHSETDLLSAYNRGATDYIIKPYYPDVLARKVAACLALRVCNCPLGGENARTSNCGPAAWLLLWQRRIAGCSQSYNLREVHNRISAAAPD